jgi:putative methyltransferase (TIGR04325 family)
MAKKLRALKQWIPPEAIRIGRHTIGYGSYFQGNFPTWEAASASAEGYTAPQLLEDALQLALTLRDESNASAVATQIIPYPLVATLMRAAALSGGQLRVIDFGGALGTTYFQCRRWLQGLKPLAWHIVEQSHYVEEGQAKLADNELKFFTSIKAAAEAKPVEAVIFSSVLQYLDSPEAILAQAISCKPQSIIIDRLPVIAGNTDEICLQKQHFPASLPRCSLPIRLFARQSIMALLGKEYKLMCEFDAADHPMGGMRRVDFKGFVFERAS